MWGRAPGWWYQRVDHIVDSIVHVSHAGLVFGCVREEGGREGGRGERERERGREGERERGREGERERGREGERERGREGERERGREGERERGREGEDRIKKVP